jgi:hypothetical protein
MSTDDPRMTPDLIFDVLDVLERHGYHRRDNRHTGLAIGAILDLACLYDGTRDVSRATYPPAPHPGPEPPVPGEADAVVLTGTEVHALAGALDIAADYNRDRAAACATCPDQTCPACQSRLRDAGTYDQMASQMLRTAQISRTAHPAQPDPGSPPQLPRQPQYAADKEAGQ